MLFIVCQGKFSDDLRLIKLKTIYNEMGEGVVKLTSKMLKKIIREELKKTLKESYWQNLGREDAEKGVPIDEPFEVMEVRALIGIILEDAYSFVKDGAEMQRSGEIPVTKRDEILPKSKMNIGRRLKQLYAKHADHNFLKTLNTVHWTGDEYALKYLMLVPSRDELSTTVSLAGGEFNKPRRVSYGLWIKGRITYAANNMDHIHSGHRGDYFPTHRSEEKHFTEEELEKAKHRKRSSGINKVPWKAPYNFDFGAKRSIKSPRFLERFPYILDAATFNPEQYGTNEALVDNWKPVGLIVTDKWVADNVGNLEYPGKHHGLRLKKLFIAQEHWNVPLYDINGNKLLDQPPEGGWPNPRDNNERI